MKAALIGIGLVVLGVGAPASAQQDARWTITDSRTDHIDGQRVTASDHVRAQVLDMAACMTDRHPDAVNAALALPPNEAGPAVRKLVDETCLRGSSVMMPLPVLRGSLLVIKYRRTLPSLPAERGDFAVGLPADAVGSRERLLRTIADCLWRADTADARKILTREAGTAEEAAAYGGLQQHLQGCSPMQPVRFSKERLAGYLAEVALIEGSASGQTGQSNSGGRL